MSPRPETPLLDQVSSPADLKLLDEAGLRQIADELRAETISAVSETGGHLGAGLGVVELTVALHAVFDTPRDRLIWDVGHQSYPHKILTGRRDRIRTLRQKDGLSGFTKRSESAYDPFGAAHSSTSISAALGFAVARDLGREDIGATIAVIGDGALSAGMAYEALNNAGAMGTRLIVVLNDNARSISSPVGAMSSYLLRLRKSEAAPTLFEAMGFRYIGPVDGHDIDQLLPALRTARDAENGPILIHAITRKGKGYLPAERAADGGHGVGKFRVDTGEQAKSTPNAPSYSSIFATSLTEEARRDDSIVAVTAAMPDGTGLGHFADHFPDRCFDVGIAEQHAVTFSAALAAAGMKPFCAIYSTFLQRGYDQVIHDVALQNLPVRFAIDRAGLVGADGATHAGAFDVAYLTCVPNMTVMAAADEAELMHMVATAAAHDTGPIAFRYPRGAGAGREMPARGQALEIGRGRVVRTGAGVALLSFGTRLDAALAAANLLAEQGISPTIADARFAKPLDKALVRTLVKEHEALITLEEGAVGGFGSQIAQFLAENGALDGALRFRSMILPDVFQDQASPSEMYDAAGLNARHIAANVRATLGLA